MRIVEIKITTHARIAHLSVVDELSRANISHTAIFELPNKFVVTCETTNISSEERVDWILRSLGLQSERKEIFRRDLPKAA